MDHASRLLATFLDLVRIDSPSFQERGVAEYVTRRMGALGMSITSDASATRTGSNTDNLLCGLSGDPRRPRILLAAHMDTVEPCRGVRPRVEGDLVTSEGETVLGADDKAGIAVILELIERVVERQLPHGPIDVLFTVAEEKGLVGARNLDWSLVTSPDYAYVLDAEGLPGEVIVGAPYYDSITAVFRGKAAHSGVEPEAGANALTAAAEALSRTRVGRIDHETTANIGTIHGGRERNIVPDRVEVKGEARSLSEDKLGLQVKAMSETLASVESDGIRVEIQTRREFEGFRFPKDHAAARLAQNGLMAVGLTPHFRLAGGGSDANIFNSHGVPALVLSVGYSNAHAIEERAHISDMETSVNCLVEMVRIACEEDLGERR